MPFFGATGTLFWISGDVFSGFQSQRSMCQPLASQCAASHIPTCMYRCGTFFWRTHTHVLFWGPCFGFLVTSPLGFKARAGCLIHIAEANVMYVPWDPPLVLHIANLLTVSIAGRRPGSYLAQGYYWHQWGSNPRSRDHEFYALTTQPCATRPRCGTWLRFEWAITRTEDERATIVPATWLFNNKINFSILQNCSNNDTGSPRPIWTVYHWHWWMLLFLNNVAY